MSSLHTLSKAEVAELNRNPSLVGLKKRLSGFNFTPPSQGEALPYEAVAMAEQSLEKRMEGDHWENDTLGRFGAWAGVLSAEIRAASFLCGLRMRRKPRRATAAVKTLGPIKVPRDRPR